MAIQTKLEHLTNRDLFSNYYLENLLPESDTWKSVDVDEIEKAFENIRELYEEHKDYVETYQEDYLQNRFINPIFEELGFEYGTEEAVKERQRTPDYGMFENDEALKKAYERKEEEDFYKNAVTIAEAKRWGRNLDKRGGVRDFTNPSHQVYVYLQETPVDWAILTNGEKWRLYYSKTSHKLDSYYEIDLPTLMEREDLESFKYFYLLFRSEAFVKDKREECFLDKVYDKSNLFSQELGEDLKENIYEAIRLLSEGFLEFPDNELNPEDDLGLIHDSSLIYLYRLIFILYAESEGRDLLDTGNRIYHDDYSLNRLKQKVCDELEKSDPKYKKWQSNLWDRLEKLFLLIDKGSKNRGIPEDELYIPAYNGGLFRTEVDEETSRENEFLQENKVGDSYLAEVIDLLTRHESKNGEGRVFVDYSSLDIRHLGSIYEGLLEYHLNVASESMIAVKEDKEEKWYSAEDFEGDETVVEELEEGEVYLTTDKGERKATGSYYTPEYIVQYIVENTLDPILDDIREDLLREGRGNFANRFAERVFELKVLDPAMGSGHFLTNAVDHLAREIVNAHEKQAEEEGAETVDESHDIHWARRQVAQKCIYGVDLNSMAVELAKVSLWLRTLAAQQPLAFLDHHLKTGNSLIGSDIEDIEELDTGSEKQDAENTTLEDFGMTKKGTMEDLMGIYKQIIEIENKDLEDIKEMEEKYHKFEHEPIKERLEAMANVHTAREFALDVPDSAFSSMAKSIDDESKWGDIEGEDWFEEAQKLAGDREFFHWKLAFPEVFYEDEGDKKEDAGFDVVMGNPPYVRQEQLRPNKNYFKKNYYSYESTADLYVYFIERGKNLLSSNSKLGFIVSNKFIRSSYGFKLRNLLKNSLKIKEIIDFGELPVFGRDIGAFPIILILNNSDPIQGQRIKAAKIRNLNFSNLSSEVNRNAFTVTDKGLEDDGWSLASEREVKVLNKMQSKGQKLEKYTSGEIYYGIKTGLNYAFVINENKRTEFVESNSDASHLINKFCKGDDVRNYIIRDKQDYLITIKSGWTRAKSGASKEKEAWEWFKSNYPKLAKHLSKYEENARQRDDQGEFWWELRPCDYYNKIESRKIIYPDIAKESRFAFDDKGIWYPANTAYIIPSEDLTLLALLNSSIVFFYMQKNSSVLGDPEKGGRLRFIRQYIVNLPVINTRKSDTGSRLSELSKKMISSKRELSKINLNLEDYLGNYDSNKSLNDLYIPPKRISDTFLTDTSEDKKKLRIGKIDFERNNEKLILKASARYKPENEEQFENLDQWGYTETELIPAMKFTGSERELALIREFTKLAVDKAGGFANFRESATKTMSILDRLEKLNLPKLSDVEKGLEKYLEQKQKAERLEEEIKETDHTIDAIVFDLYDLTEDEVKVVLDSLDTDEEEKMDIMGGFRET